MSTIANTNALNRCSRRTRILRHTCFRCNPKSLSHLQRNSTNTSPASQESRLNGEVLGDLLAGAIVANTDTSMSFDDSRRWERANTSPRGPIMWRSIHLGQMPFEISPRPSRRHIDLDQSLIADDLQRQLPLPLQARKNAMQIIRVLHDATRRRHDPVARS